MRHYTSDSVDAVARILTLTMLADGGIDKSELDCLDDRKVLERHGITVEALERVTREFCEDIHSTLPYRDALQCRLSPQLLESLLQDVTDACKRAALYHTIHELVKSDGQIGTGEALLLSRVAAAWNMPDQPRAPS